jgi:tripartite-type tricarboxylate transporter receptor subunit TctC
MSIARFVVRALPIALLVASSAAAAQNSFPTRPVRMVTSEVGGGTDLGARLVSQGLAGLLGQPVIVENRGGAAGAIAADIVQRASPDGHTMLYYTNALWLAPFLRDNVGYDPVKSFVPVILVAKSPSVLVVHPSVAANSVKELIALAKAKPGQLNYGSGAAGMLAAELLKHMAGVNIVRIAYKGAGPALTAAMAGEVQVLMAASGSIGPQIKAGRVRALAVTSANRSLAFPDLPTVAEAALPGYESVAVFGIFAPAKTPAAIVNRLNRDIAQVLARPEVKDKLLAAGIEVTGGTPEQFATWIRTEMATMGKVIKAAGIRSE